MKLFPLLCLSGCLRLAAAEPPRDTALASEVKSGGWIGFSAQTPHGDWDLFLMRPDGSDRRALTDTREFNEAGLRFSPDGRRLLYYRMPRSVGVDNNTYGTFDLVICDSNGGNTVILGASYPWASWSPDSRQLACLTPKGIRIIDFTTRGVVRTVPRNGIVQQLVWSPDGKAFTGTANGLGPFWNIASMDGEGTAIHPVSDTERYNCTPDWHPDGRHIVFSRGTIPGQDSRAEIWLAGADGRDRRMLYAEGQRHLYGACVSPDARYLLFTRSVQDLGAVGKSQTTLALIRWEDTPMLGNEDLALRSRFPNAKPARRLDLGPGWEPHWTASASPGTP